MMLKDKMSSNIAIILGFFNGGKYILEQLDSIISQSHKNFHIYIFDDYSDEKLINIDLKLFIAKHSNITIIRREYNIGYAKNFLLGLRDVGPDYDFYAFSDQDDIWEKNKLEIGLQKIKELNSHSSVLYCSRTSYFKNDSSSEIGYSKIWKKKPQFKNALIQNIVGGNTILMNKKARNLIVNSLVSDQYISHDWWCYLLIAASGGNIIFDPLKLVKYRQHRGNLIGGNNKLKDKIIRFTKFFYGNFKEWNDLNIKNLMQNKKLITKNNLITLQRFIDARNEKNIFLKILIFRKSGVFRQSFLENFIFIIGIIFNKI